MSALFLLAYRQLISKRTRTVLTTLAIALGTTVISASFSTNNAIEDSLQTSADAIAGNADVLLEATDSQGFPERVLQQVLDVPGVRLAAGRVQKRTFFRTATDRGFVELLGVDPQADPQVHSYGLLAGRPLSPSPSTEVLVGDRWASRFGIRVGDSLELITKDGFSQFQVVGIIVEADPGRASSEGILRAHVAAVQDAFQLGHRLQRVDVVLADAKDVAELESQLEERIGAGYIFQRVPDIRQELRESVIDFQLLLFFFGAIAIFVGAFLVYNTITMTVVEQTREIGLLRTVGASMDQIRGITLAQALLLALWGTVPGTLLGQVLALGLVALFEALRQTPLTETPFSIIATVWGITVGSGMTMLAATLPAWRAGRLTPLEAQRAFPTTQIYQQNTRRQALAVIGTLLSVLFLAWPVEEVWRWTKGPILLCLFMLLVYLSPLFVDGIAKIWSVLFRRWATGVTLLVQGNFQRERARTAATLAGFFVSFAFVVALNNVAESATSAGQRWVSSLFPGEYAITAPVPQARVLASEFSNMAGIDYASPVGMRTVTWNGSRYVAAGLDPISYSSAFEFVEGDRNQAFTALRRGNAVLVPTRFARAWEIRRGDMLRLQFGITDAVFTVAGTIAHSFPSPDNYGTLILSLDDLRRYGGEDSFHFITIKALPETDQQNIFRELTLLAEQYGLEANTVANLRTAVQQAMQLLLILFGGLVATGIVIAVLGLVNTMMMNVAGRTRELGLLRAVGMTQIQAQWLTVTEALVLGIAGAILGIAGGAFLTRLLIELARTPDFDPQYAFSPAVALLALGVGVTAAVLAAWYPAHRSASIRIVDAIRFE